MRWYYELLEISEDATEAEIEHAYKRAASKHHPDKNLGNETEASERFKEMKEAYECLSDPERRQIYDETGDTTVKDGNPAEDLFMHLLNEVSEHMESTSEIIEKIRQAIEQMIEECSNRKVETDRKIIIFERMLKALRFKGKGTNLIEGVLIEKKEKLRKERTNLDEAVTAAKLVHEMLNEYEATDYPSPRSAYETAESVRIKTIESMLRDAFSTGRRKGGMPFSGV